jgi:hypothetical protein
MTLYRRIPLGGALFLIVLSVGWFVGCNDNFPAIRSDFLPTDSTHSTDTSLTDDTTQTPDTSLVEDTTQTPDSSRIEDTARCTDITIIEESASFHGKSTFWGEAVYINFTPELHAPHVDNGYDRVVIKLPEKNGYRQKPGVYDLGTDTNISPQNCRQCVEVIQDVFGDHINVRNFQVSGTMELDSVNSVTGESAGRLVDVYFREIAEVGYYQWGGYTSYDSCIHIPSARWNTYADNNRPCNGLYGCANEKVQACDPTTLRCVPAPCNATSDGCLPGTVCMEQEGHYRNGACYKECVPFDGSPTPPGYQCVPTSYDGKRGILKKKGTIAEGEHCDGSVLTTSCEDSCNCSTRSPFWPKETRCYRICDYWDTNRSCFPDKACGFTFYAANQIKAYCARQRCLFHGMCLPVEAIDSAQIGQRAVRKGDGEPCAYDGTRARGVLVYDADSVLYCRQIARFAVPGDCPPGYRCDSLIIHPSTGHRRNAFKDVGVCRKILP